MAFWQKTKTGGKAGFDKLYGLVDKLGPPVNRLSNKLGSEAFWPTTLDKESDKAARILKSFCKDGFYQEEERPSADGPQSKQRVLKKIPAEVIRNAHGLAIFTTMRTGLWFSGAGGSGVLIGRKDDGTWSPPSGIMLHTAGLGFLVGVDIYDCVVVINTKEALAAFSSIRCTLGGEISAVAGPVGVGGLLETELHKRQAPVFTYLKSRGFYAGVQVDGTIIIERTDCNEEFYGERIGVKDILAGKVRDPPPYETRKLLETVKAAQGDTDVDQSLIPSEPPPGDYEIEDQNFGIPAKEDPDPYGVLALNNAGLEIREAGTQKRPPSEQFEFHPSPTSPIYTTFRKSMERSSIDTSRRSSWRTSTISSFLEPRTPTMVSMSTQTEFEETTPIKVPAPPLPPRASPLPSPTLPAIAEAKPIEEQPTEEAATNYSSNEDSRPSTANRESQAFDDVYLDEEEPVIAEIHQAAAPQAIRARIVQVAKPIPPKVPPRNPFRKQANPASDDATRDASASASPVSTPSLQRDNSSTSSLSSIEGLDRVTHALQPHQPNTNEPKPEERSEIDGFHSVPESPVKTIPGGFI